MRKDIVLPALAVAGGGAGLLLRRWQLAAAYDLDTQLFAPGAPATYALLALLALLALGLALLCRGGETPGDYLPAFRCPQSAHMAALAAAAFLFLGAGGLGLLEGMEVLALWRADPASAPVTYPVALLLCALLCFPAGGAVLLLGRAAYRGGLVPAASLLASFPAFAGLTWLFAAHLDSGTDPVLMRYGFILAAAALFTLAHYDFAGYLFGRRHPRRGAFCALMGSVLGLTALADRPGWFATALTAAFTLSSLAQARALLRGVFGPPWRKRPPEGRTPSGAREEGGLHSGDMDMEKEE